jgi:hypothetical protein
LPPLAWAVTATQPLPIPPPPEPDAFAEAPGAESDTLAE